MNVNNLIDKIYDLNDVKDGFWKDYLEENRNDFRITWHRSCGCDLRPLTYIRSLANSKKKAVKAIGRELKTTDIIFSDAMQYADYYDTFLNLWRKNHNGIFYGYELTNTKPDQFFRDSSTYSVEPFKLFTQQEREALKSLIFRNGEGWETKPIINTKREFDGFAMKIYGYNFSQSYVTIIYLCHDDRVVKKLFDDYRIDVVCLFENRCGGKAGGLPMNYLFNDYDNFEKIKTIKYICTDNCYYDDENARIKYRYDFIADNYHYVPIGDSFPYLLKNGDYSPRGNGFCLFTRKLKDEQHGNENL